MARARRAQSGNEEQFTCPECGRTFGRAAALGAHRRSAHGVVGTSARRSTAADGSRRTGRRRGRARTSAGGSSARSRRSRADGAVDRDALLKALFPNGIPPKEDVIRSVNAWLDEAERLALLR
jgi:C2H2-type zinc finger